MINGVNAVNTAHNTINTTTSAVSGNFSSYLGESQTLDSIFQKAAATYQVPVNLLKAIGKAVYICRCGIDKKQHCTNCRGCSKNEIVLFIEHSTEYKAEKDPAFAALKAIIDAQDNTIAGIAA